MIVKPKITKPWNNEMYEYNDIVAGLMKGKIRYSIEKNKDNWDILNELMVLCGGIRYGDGYEIDELYNECITELERVENYWLNEEFPYAVQQGYVDSLETEINFVGYGK